MWETWVRFLGWKDALEEGMATLSSILAWIILWTEEPGGLHGVAKSRTLRQLLTLTLTFSLSLSPLMTQMVKNSPAMRETWVPSLGWEDPLEEGMAAHSSILAWRIPMDRGAR